MDKIIEKKKGIAIAFTKKALPYWFGTFLTIFILWLIMRDDATTLRVNAGTLSISEVLSGEFNDYIRVSGQVQPMTTIQISPQEGGIVQEILIEEGSKVKAGDEILRMSNDNLDLQILNSEAELAEIGLPEEKIMLRMWPFVVPARGIIFSKTSRVNPAL